MLRKENGEMARPWKYDQLIRTLEDETLYHTARVINSGEQQGLFDFSFDDETKSLSEIEKRNVMKNARSSLAHFVVKHLPQEPDGYVKSEGKSRAKYPAWYGKRWKSMLEGNEK